MLPKDAESPRLRGLSMKLEDLTLALVLDMSIVKAYINFKIVRAENQVNKSVETDLIDISQLVHERTGWLGQNESTFRPIIVGHDHTQTFRNALATADSWKKACEDHKRELYELRVSMLGRKKKPEIPLNPSKKFWHCSTRFRHCACWPNGWSLRDDQARRRREDTGGYITAIFSS